MNKYFNNITITKSSIIKFFYYYENMKKMFWEFSWLDIKFTTLGIKLKFFKKPSAEFYSKLYINFFSRYKSYDSLPFDYRQEKSKTAHEISKLIKNEKKILSLGCGIGYVEKEIVSKLPKLTIDAYDFATASNKLIKDVENVNSIDSLEDNKKYKFIYCTQLLYSLNDKEILKFSNMVKDKLCNGGTFLTVDTSLNQLENQFKKFSFNQSIKLKILNFIAPLYIFMFRWKSAQFWGWKRDNYELINIFRKNGFKIVKVFSSVKQSFLMFRVAEN